MHVRTQGTMVGGRGGGSWVVGRVGLHSVPIRLGPPPPKEKKTTKTPPTQWCQKITGFKLSMSLYRKYTYACAGLVVAKG